MGTVMNIYLDMDDVVADWMGYARAYLKRNWQEGEMLPDTEWRRLKDDQRMYSKLPLKEHAYDLVDWCRTYAKQNNCNLYFLSAIPHGNDMPWAPQDKVFWGQEYFPDIPVFLGPYAHQKYMHVRNPGDILIDDRRSNCEEWQRAGGRSHIYKDWFVCKKWLEDTLLNGRQLQS
jgi:5'(3')-deoxyribonucleotidase